MIEENYQSRNNRGISNILWLIILVAGFGLQLYLIYYGYIIYHYIAPPGSDVIPHYLNIKTIIETGKINFSYPPLFHLIVANLSKLFHHDPFSILTYWTPVLIILPSIAMYFLLRQLFDTKISVLTTLIFLLSSNFPLYAFIDGNYPDMLSYGFFGILLFAFIIRYFKNHKVYNLIIASFLMILIAFSHHFTFANILIILIIFGLLQLFYFFLDPQKKFKFWGAITILIVIGLFSISIYFANRLYGSVIVNYANGFITNKPAMHNTYFNLPLTFSDYPDLAGPLVWYFGFFGLIYLVLTTFEKNEEVKTKQLVIVWFLVLFLLSRFSASGVPARFARELAPALVLCIGFLLNYVFNHNYFNYKKYQSILSFGLIGFLIITNSSLYAGLNKLPESFSRMVWFWPKDQDKINYLKETVSLDTEILYNPKANLFMPIKSTNKLVPIELSPEEKSQVTANLDKEFVESKISLKTKSGFASGLTDYQKLIHDLRQKYEGEKYIFIDVKPPSDPDEKTYFHYAGFKENNKVLIDMASSGEVIHRFPDGAYLVKMD